MRIAILSDIHGNLPALEVVLAAIAAEGIERVVCLGDVATLGPQPHEVIARLLTAGTGSAVHSAAAAAAELRSLSAVLDTRAKRTEPHMVEIVTTKASSKGAWILVLLAVGVAVGLIWFLSTRLSVPVTLQERGKIYWPPATRPTTQPVPASRR